MNSKECLKRIDEKNYLTEREHKEFLSVIEKDLDKLKKLEKENEELKEQIERLEDEFNGLCDSNHNLKQEFLEVKNEKEVLVDTCKNYLKEHYNTKKVIEIILKYKINPSTFIFTRKIYKESCGKDLTFEKAHSLLEFDGTQEEFELLKGVLEE